MIKNNSFNLTFFPLKLTLAISGLIIWLCALASLLYSSPKYVPYTEALLHTDFETAPQKNNTSSQLVLEPWHHVSQGVTWEPGNGFAGSAGIKLTANDKNKPSVEWVLKNPQRFSFLKFCGKMRSEKIIRGEEEWYKARFLVYFTKEGEGQWDIPHVAGSLTGTSDWKEFIEIFPVPSNAEEAYVVIGNTGESGSVWCDDILLMPVKLNTRYLLYKNIFFVSGAVIGVFLCIVMVIILGLRKRDGFLIFAIVAVIIIGVTCSINSLETLGNIFNLELRLLKKIGHLFLFFILGAVSIWQLDTRLSVRTRESLFPPYSLPVFAGLVLFACLTESLQFFTFDRTPGFIDLLIDVTGIGTGIVLACFVKNCANRR